MPQTDYSGQRWFAAKNECEYEIPGFALIQFHDRVIEGQRNYFINNFAEETDVVFEVERPTSEIVAEGNPARFCFNGPVPIPPKSKKGRGLITQGFPAQVLHDGSTDSLPNGRRCGPKADSFYCWSTGSMFTCVTHDGTEAVRNDQTGVHTVWLQRGVAFAGGHARGTFSGGIPAATIIPVTFTQPPTSLGIVNVGDPAPAAPNFGFVVQESGMYNFGWQATVQSPDAPRGYPLAVRTYLKRAASSVPEATIWEAIRYQMIESDTTYGNDFLIGAENMAMTGWENLLAGDEIFFKSVTPYILMLAVGSAWTMKFKPYFDESTPDHGGLSYP